MNILEEMSKENYIHLALNRELNGLSEGQSQAQRKEIACLDYRTQN